MKKKLLILILISNVYNLYSQSCITTGTLTFNSTGTPTGGICTYLVTFTVTTNTGSSRIVNFNLGSAFTPSNVCFSYPSSGTTLVAAACNSSPTRQPSNSTTYTGTATVQTSCGTTVLTTYGITALNNGGNNCANLTSPTALPIVLNNFSGYTLEKSIELGWSTASEKNFKWFEVEKSLNAVEFSFIAKILGTGNQLSGMDYNFSDLLPSIGQNYYRLKMMDNDGTFENSKIISVEYGSNAESFVVLGNPTNNQEIEVYTKNISKESIKLYTITGEELPIELNDLTNKIVIKPISILKNGQFIIRAKTENGVLVSKKIIVN